MIGSPGAPRERDASRSEFSWVTDITADGSMLVVGEFGNGDSNGAYLVPASGAERAALHLARGLPLAVSPSGTRVLVNNQRALTVVSTGSGEQRTLAAPGRISAARWIDERSLVGTYEHASAARMWRLSLDSDPRPLTAPGEAGQPALDPARRRCAFVDRAGQLIVLDLARGARTILPGSFVQRVACGWLARDAIVVRSATAPIQLTLVDPATGATTPYLEISPPALGLRNVDSFVLRGDGSLYAYSYGQELSQLYLMS